MKPGQTKSIADKNEFVSALSYYSHTVRMHAKTLDAAPLQTEGGKDIHDTPQYHLTAAAEQAAQEELVALIDLHCARSLKDILKEIPLK